MSVPRTAVTSALRTTVRFAALLLVAGCSQLPTTGPSTKDVETASQAPEAVFQIVEVNDAVTRQLAALKRAPLFSETLGVQGYKGDLGLGDSLEVSIWEAPPATLFGGVTSDLRSPSTARAATLPDQVVDREGYITVPFAGRIKAAGQTPQTVEAEIVRRLKGKANQPEAVVRITRNASSIVTVVGEVNSAVRMPLTPSGERLLDALAAAGGVRHPVSKMTLQVTRGQQYQTLPLDQVIRDPRQNVPLLPGDVITALNQPLSFTALGATGKNDEISFEAQGINLAQALARAGGLNDNRSHPQGVFIFRMEAASTLAWPRTPVRTTAEGLVPVVYRVDLRDPGAFFVMQGFPVHHKDVLYVSNAPATELQKFLTMLYMVVYPVLTTIQVTQ
jgi:polysaccharide export outer membrane protein